MGGTSHAAIRTMGASHTMRVEVCLRSHGPGLESKGANPARKKRDEQGLDMERPMEVSSKWWEKHGDPWPWLPV